MKLAMFVRNKGDIRWGIFFENIRLNLEKGNSIFIGDQEDMKELKGWIENAKPSQKTGAKE